MRRYLKGLSRATGKTTHPPRLWMRGACLSLVLATPFVAQAGDVSFRHDVMPVLARAGCNQGACHGNLNGKGGFRLSLRGEDPATDLITLTRDGLARRTDPLRPSESLLLRKATAPSPRGGPRFAAGGFRVPHPARLDRRRLRDDRRTCRAHPLDVARPVASFPPGRPGQDRREGISDGSARDLTHLAIFDRPSPGRQHRRTASVTKLRDAEPNVVVRYLDRQVPVTLAFRRPRAVRLEGRAGLAPD